MVFRKSQILLAIFAFSPVLPVEEHKGNKGIESPLPERSAHGMKDCPDIAELTMYLEHKISPEETTRFEAHFVACRICRKIVARVLRSESVIADPVSPRHLFS